MHSERGGFEYPEIEIDLKGGRTVPGRIVHKYKTHRPLEINNDRLPGRFSEKKESLSEGAGLPKIEIYTTEDLRLDDVTGIIAFAGKRRFAMSVGIVISIIQKPDQDECMVTYRNKGNVTQMIADRIRVTRSDL